MTRKPPKSHKIYLSASDYFAADAYLRESLSLFKTIFRGELQFIPRGPTCSGTYKTRQMKDFSKHVEAVIKEHGLIPYKPPGESDIVCCRTNAPPLCSRHPALHDTRGVKLDPEHRTLVVYPFRFNLREKQFREKLKCWRKEFRGTITIKPQGGYYSVNQKDMPNYIVKICRSLRIKAEISKNDPAVVECDLKTLLPKRRRRRQKRQKEKQDLQKENVENAEINQKSLDDDKMEKAQVTTELDQMIRPKGPSENDIKALTRDVEIKFNNFPKVVTAQTKNDDDDAKCTSLVMVVDLQNFPVSTGGDYAYEILIWANSYPFLVVNFITGPPSRVPLFNEPKIRKQVISVIGLLSNQHDIHYTYEIAKHNSNLIICKHK